MTLPKSKYKGIYPFKPGGRQVYWEATLTINGVRKRKAFQNERDAALFYDKLRLEAGMNPVNILKPKP